VDGTEVSYFPRIPMENGRKRGVDLAISFTMEEYLNLKKPELWKTLEPTGSNLNLWALLFGHSFSAVF
jgi:hypothetical protein